MDTVTRQFGRTSPRWHPHVDCTTHGKMMYGGALSLPLLCGPAGYAGAIPGTDLPYYGMDPSDPRTHTRQYNPQPGMIPFLNFDGAVPNQSQAVAHRKNWRHR